MTRKLRNSKSALDVEIISSPGNPIPTKELLARLLKIADELSAVDQDEVERYREIAAKLANPKLIKHKNIGVQAFAAHAISDIIRIFAPEAPFSSEELSDIFQAFCAQFAHLWDEENPYFIQQSYILKRVVEVRSVVLISDLPDSLQLVTELFETMYELTTKGFPSKLEQLAADMLAETVSETDHIPQSVVSLIIKRLTVAPDSKIFAGASNISNPAFKFSLTICESNTDKMARQVAQLFSEMLDESANLTNAKDHHAPFKALEKIHESSVQIWAHVPDLLGSVMGLISDELNSDDEGVRVLATKTISDMMASSTSKNGNSAVTFVSYHRDTWKNWLQKSADNSPQVRAAWIEKVPAILALETTSEINTELRAGLAKCLKDSSEKVRFCACQALNALSFQVLCKKACNASILETLFALCREKQVETRTAAIAILADLYDNCMAAIARSEVIDLGGMDPAHYDEVIRLIANGVPNKLLQLNYINDKSITAAVDIALFEKLLPFEDSAENRVGRLCLFLKELDEKSKLAFIAITRRQHKNVEVLLKFLDLAEEYASSSLNDPENKENLAQLASHKEIFIKVEKIVGWFSAQFPSGIHSYESINTFFKLKNLRFINLLKNCVNSQLDYKTVKNSAKELLSKLSDPKNIRLPKVKVQVPAEDMVSNFKILLYRSSQILYNKSNAGELIKLSHEEASEAQAAGNELISMITMMAPGVFKNHIETLASMVKTGELEDVQVPLLKSFYRVIKKFPESYPNDVLFDDRIHELATNGDYVQAKYCSKIMGCSESKTELVLNLLESIMPLNPENRNFATHLSVVAEMYLIAPSELILHSSHINSTIIEEVLKKNRLSFDEVQSVAKMDWIDDDRLSENKILVEKLISIRLIQNRLRSAATEPTDATTTQAIEKRISLLTNLVSNRGEIVKVNTEASVVGTPACYRLRIMLAAGLAILKLAKYPKFTPFISHEVVRKMTRFTLDDCLQVRKEFVKKLEFYLQNNLISNRFLHVLFFMGHEPNADLRTEVDTWIFSQHNRAEARRDILYETISARLIHAIAHDSRFCRMISDTSKDTLERELEAYLYVLKYAAMFIDTIAKEANISLLYYVASRVKQFKDNTIDTSYYELEELPAEVLNLYRVAELFQLMLKELADSKSWNIQTWPGKIELPVDLYSKMGDYEQAQEFISRVYIGDLIQIKLREELSKKSLTGAKKRPAQAKAENSVKKPRKGAQPAKPKAQKVAKPRAREQAKKTKEIQEREVPVSRKSRRAATKVYYGESDSEPEEVDSLREGSQDEYESD